MSTTKAEFRDFCAKSPSLPLFLSYDWMELISADREWDVVMEKKGEQIVGFFVFLLRKKLGKTFILNPVLTPFTGLWLDYPEGQKYASKIGYEKEIISALIDQLPKFAFLSIKLHPDFQNGLPFHWKGFELTNRYTYLLTDLNDQEMLWSNCGESTRRQIRKGEKGLRVLESDHADQLFEMLERNKKELLNFSPALLKNIHRHYAALGQCRIIEAQDENAAVHAMIMIVWDEHSAYYLAGCSEAQFKNSGAMSLLLWESIKHAGTVTRSFNFEGSMIAPIERFFRGFGGQLTPYSQVVKANSLPLKLWQSLR